VVNKFTLVILARNEADQVPATSVQTNVAPSLNSPALVVRLDSQRSPSVPAPVTTDTADGHDSRPEHATNAPDTPPITEAILGAPPQTCSIFYPADSKGGALQSAALMLKNDLINSNAAGDLCSAQKNAAWSIFTYKAAHKSDLETTIESRYGKGTIVIAFPKKKGIQ
jgi:hypothetical protein